MKYLENYKMFIQPNEWSCGPSCVKMVSDYINSENDNIENIIKIGRVDNIFGATQKRMERILISKKISYTLSKNLNTTEIESGLSNGFVYVILVFLDKYPHWILVTGVTNKKFNINDPYQGKISLSEDELINYFSIKKNNIYSIGSKLLVPNRIIKINTNETLNK